PLFSSFPSTTLFRSAKHSISLSIVSSNSRANVSQILGNQCVELFSSIECGASVFGKATRLRRVLKHMNIRPQDAIYIGDQATDIDRKSTRLNSSHVK